MNAAKVAREQLAPSIAFNSARNTSSTSSSSNTGSKTFGNLSTQQLLSPVEEEQIDEFQATIKNPKDLQQLREEAFELTCKANDLVEPGMYILNLF